jgi:hypothetical protein
MKFGSTLLLMALTVGLAALSVVGTRPDDGQASGKALYEDADSWFV